MSSTLLQRRREALAAIDSAPFSWYHVRAIIVAGVGFFTDAYDIFAVNFANILVGLAYYSSGKVPSNADTAIKVATSAGTVIGQLGFGALADVLGRKKMYGIELMVIIVATLGLALTAGGRSTEIVGVFIFWRVILGTGVGGDYPLSAIITSEFATVKWRGAMMGAVFANQGWGQLTCAIVSICCTIGFKDSFLSGGTVCNERCQIAADKSWRIIYGFGAVPAVFALYFRLTIPETIRYSLDVEGDDTVAAKDAVQYVSGKIGAAKLTSEEEVARVRNKNDRNPTAPPKASFRDFIRHYSQWKNGKVLLGTAGSWFMLDVAFYGLGLNTSIVLNAIGYSAPKNKFVYDTLYNQGVGNIILSCAGLIPGYWLSVLTIDRFGRKTIQLMGFIILTALFIILGFGYNHINTNGKFALYCLANLFFNFGPNTTTFIVPGEVFPTRYRSTSHGISAASGKIGAIVAQVLIGPLRTRGATKDNASPWLDHVLQIFALFMFMGIPLTLLIPETARKTLEELSGEDEYNPDYVDDLENSKRSIGSHEKSAPEVQTH
ncbi:major facilitator superfamily domain-containing protein [Protomyces lactucae-debilis]|uniref:Major facilitator superfamily domain-containing protein n=1 Tax=Protomyces lactucae-debilis TaxID=2754530 RepID=A0A1Y2FD83_PROLT|nr:major facilitator superfamily domain-containing protein [Protomyces lactucae-debilis]ORY81879.1 major facilitator superfamily domain-containing protein [Protomyces lactucae-debilis]